jgi:NAD(P)-dependent dehydrogenase (short-subunit alcohol dehydrogenase family)
VVDEICRFDGRAIASYDSVATPEGGASIVQAAIDNFGRLDAVVSNAGILTNASFEEVTAELWRNTLSVHLDGSFYLSQPAFRHMKSQGYGRFVFTSSSAGMFGVMQQAHYAAAKAGVFGLKNVIAIEGAHHGILANAVLPWGSTRMLLDAAGGEQAFEAMPWLRQLDPKFVVPLVVFVASKACQDSHRNFTAAAGRYARVFAGVGKGWFAGPGVLPGVDDIAQHLETISTTENFYVPASVADEAAEVVTRLGAGL